MANALFTKFKEALLSQSPSVDVDTDNIKVVGVDHADDTPLPATDQFLSDIGAAARVMTTANLSGKSVTNGIFDATDEPTAGVTGDVFESLVIYEDTGVAGTSALMVFIDTATGLPFTPNGGSVTIAWDNGASKIFTL